MNLEDEGYFEIREIKGAGLCALMRFVFTIGLVVNIDDAGYERRCCYSELRDALDDINSWNGTGHPEGPWIKCKGIYGEISKEETIQS